MIHPDWPAPPRVKCLMTTREGGVSVAPWASLNLGDHVGDTPAHVAANRERLRHGLSILDDYTVLRIGYRNVKLIERDRIWPTQTRRKQGSRQEQNPNPNTSERHESSS